MTFAEQAWWEMQAWAARDEVKRIRDQYKNDFAWRRQMAVSLASRYHGRDFEAPHASMTRFRWETGLSDSEDEGGALVRNKYYEYVDTVVAMVGAADEPKPDIMLSDATWTQKKKAKLNSRMLQSEYALPQGRWPNLNALGMHGLRLAWGCTGSVAAKVYPWPKESKVIVELHDTLDMFMDESETLYGTPRTLGECTFHPRHRLLSAFPEHAAAIRDAPSQKLDAASLTLTGRHPRVDLVQVTEAWATKGLDGSKGKHIAFLDDGTILKFEDFDEEDWPFAFLHASPQMTGFWGIPPIDLVDLEIRAVNEIVNELDDAHADSPKQVHYVHEGSLTDISDIKDVHHVQVVRVTDREYKPTIENPRAFPDTSLQLLENHEDAIARVLGIPEMRSAGRAQPGLPSAIAQRQAMAVSDGRAGFLHRSYNQWLGVDVGRKVLKAQRQLAEQMDGEGLRRKWDGEAGFSREIRAEDFLDLDEAALHVQLKAVSGTKNTPQERAQYAEELLEKGVIPFDVYTRMLEHFDTPGELSAVNTQRKWVAWQIEKWTMIGPEKYAEQMAEKEDQLEEGETLPDFYMSPRPWLRKPDAFVQVIDGLMEAEMDGAPQSVLSYFEDFLSELGSMMAAEAAPPPDAAGAPPAGPVSPPAQGAPPGPAEGPAAVPPTQEVIAA